MDNQDQTMIQLVAEILPDNERTHAILKARKEAEEMRLAKIKEIQEIQARQQRQANLRKRQEEEKKQQRLQNEEKLKKQKAEEEKSLNRLEPRLQKFIEDLQAQDSPQTFSISGLDLGPARCRILAQNIAFNNSLLSISLNRKAISDLEGESLAQMLFSNMTLRSLELEGNRLGPKSAAMFGSALKVNMSLKMLDLSNNSLTLDGQDQSGAIQLFEALPFNSTLQTLMVSNNGLNREAGEKLRAAIEENCSVICVDFSMNDFAMEDSEEIQEQTTANKEKLDSDRLQEWQERKGMLQEFTKLKLLYLEEHVKKERELLDVEMKLEAEQDVLAKWQRYQVEAELEKQRLIERLEEASALRSKFKKNKKPKRPRRS